jgi:hypothetical protein
MKVIELTALDGSKWHIPAALVAASYSAYYKGDAPDDSELTDWAQNNMNWSEVKTHSVQVEAPDENNMEDSWANGEMEVVERETPLFELEPPRATEASNEEVTVSAEHIRIEVGSGRPFTITVDGNDITLGLGGQKMILTTGSKLPVDPEAVAEILTGPELLGVYNRMDGAAIIARHEPGSYGDAILIAYGRAVIRAAVDAAMAEVA